LPSTVVHAERKQYWTQSNERVSIVEKVMNDGSIGSTFKGRTSRGTMALMHDYAELINELRPTAEQFTEIEQYWVKRIDRGGPAWDVISVQKPPDSSPS
jgi:hypothetical protein